LLLLQLPFRFFSLSAAVDEAASLGLGLSHRQRSIWVATLGC
jgi:hypothetical protein